MAGEVRFVNGAPDRRNEKGAWMKYWSEFAPEGKIGFHSRGSCLWRRMQSRVKEDGPYQSKFHTYRGCSTSFVDFQEFMDWATAATGYAAKDEHGRVYCLDKDVLVPGNKIYCAERCRFIPNALNMLLTDTQAKRGAHPIGVYYHKARKRYRAQVKDKGETLELGEFLSSVEAHAAWQLAKADQVRKACYQWSLTPYFQEDVAEALMLRATALLKDRAEGKISLSSKVFRNA